MGRLQEEGTQTHFTPGPLDAYRKKASFDWKKLKAFIDAECCSEDQEDMWKTMEAMAPIFRKKHEIPATQDETRRTDMQVFFAFANLNRPKKSKNVEDLQRLCHRFLPMASMNQSGLMKYYVQCMLSPKALRSLGTEVHEELHKKVIDGEVVLSFCMTEIGHGSNISALRTTATYDKATEEFVLHTPDFEAAKCWAGNLANTATQALIFARLLVEGEDCGIHCFVARIRDPKTMLPFPGVTIVDMGEKVGLNGVDNGLLIFDNYRIPKSGFLNKNADVSKDGRYITKKSEKQLRNDLLGALLNGRNVVIHSSYFYCAVAITTAVRYAAIRKTEVGGMPLLETQNFQLLLLPQLAAVYVLNFFSQHFVKVNNQMIVDQMDTSKEGGLKEATKEFHALSSAAKSFSTWLARDVLQVSIEACQPYGSLKEARLGILRDHQDGSMTYEGENNVLLIQTSNWLLKLWLQLEQGREILTPLKSVDFLNHAQQILSSRGKFLARTVDEVLSLEFIESTFQWLVCFLLRETARKVQDQLQSGQPLFWAISDSQVFFAKTLTMAFITLYYIKRSRLFVEGSTDRATSDVLRRTVSLFGVWSLSKYSNELIRGGYLTKAEEISMIENALIESCALLKDEAVALVDAIAHPDYAMDSFLTNSDGLMYKRLQTSLTTAPGTFSRPKWWGEIVDGISITKSKL